MYSCIVVVACFDFLTHSDSLPEVIVMSDQIKHIIILEKGDDGF